MRTCEQILQALETLLKTIDGVDVSRNKVLPAEVGPDGEMILWDGSGDIDEYVMGGENLWVWNAELQILVQEKHGSDRDARFDQLNLSVGDLVAANRTLGGLCDWLDVAPGKIDDLAVLGAAGIRSGVLVVSATYSSNNPTG